MLNYARLMTFPVFGHLTLFKLKFSSIMESLKQETSWKQIFIALALLGISCCVLLLIFRNLPPLSDEERALVHIPPTSLQHVKDLASVGSKVRLNFLFSLKWFSPQNKVHWRLLLHCDYVFCSFVHISTSFFYSWFNWSFHYFWCDFRCVGWVSSCYYLCNHWSYYFIWIVSSYWKSR